MLLERKMTTDYNVERSRIQEISDKADALTGWLSEHALHCETVQKHLDPNTVEQAYWHYGYLCALKDILRLLDTDSTK
jgi:hypothetical protein